MDLSRRRFVQTTLLVAAGAGVTAACGGSDSSSGTKDGKELTLWYWGGGLSDKVVADAKKQFTDVTLKSSIIGGTFKQKLLTTMNGRSFVPDITGIKGEDIASFLPNANRFIDLNTLGADKIASEYLGWKLKQGQTQDGKQIGFPIDIGPTAMYYREDMFAKAGLPTDPAKVAAEISTWEDYFAIGADIQKAYPKAFLLNNMTAVFDMSLGQGGKRMIDEDNKFIGDQEHVRKCWDLAVQLYESGADAKINDESLKAAVADGSVATQLGAAWMTLDVKDMAPNTSGKWRVAPLPGGPSNMGGSFLALTKECRNPEVAFEIIKWLLSPENQGRGFTDAALFPSAPAAYELPALTEGDPFFGGQKTIEVFGPAAEKVPAFYEAPANAAVAVPYYNELTSIESKGKKPDDAWKDAVEQAKQIAKQQGVS